MENTEAREQLHDEHISPVPMAKQSHDSGGAHVRWVFGRHGVLYCCTAVNGMVLTVPNPTTMQELRHAFLIVAQCILTCSAFAADASSDMQYFRADAGVAHAATALPEDLNAAGALAWRI